MTGERHLRGAAHLSLVWLPHMKIGVITDAHANLPALEAALHALRAEGCDAIVHVGDAIAIGPFPAECVELLRSTPNLECLMGNHEVYCVDGLPTPQPAYMSDGEVHHQRWTHAQITTSMRDWLAQWPFTLDRELEGVKVRFQHYGLLSGHDFVFILANPTGADLDRIFGLHGAALVFYGHSHGDSDVQAPSGTRYVNPGSLGCHATALGRYCIATFARGQFVVEHRLVPYDDRVLFDAFEQRQVPERQFIYRTFFGRRFR